MSREPAHWQSSVLLTDLYQLTMLQGYFEAGMDGIAVFEFFVRKLPPRRGFLLAAGVEQALRYLENLHFSERDLEALSATGLFGDGFLEWLARLRFTGDVEAMAEGTAFFANEPALRVTASLPQAQLVESRLINILHMQILVASKAARCVLAASDRQLVDFGMRRAHGSEAALMAARASYLAGFAGTATVAARPAFGVPIFGTMAHSFIQAHESESAAFERFARCHRGAIVLLIDTYDTEAGARRVVELADRLAPEGLGIHAVRLDSGDLDELSRSVRRILDEGGHSEIRIFASGGLDEAAIESLLAGGAPIDGFGVGTTLDVSADAPALDCVYKLQEYGGVARRKRSSGKATWPGRKQVFRHYDSRGMLDRDVLTVTGDDQPGEPLILPVMRDGRRIGPPADLEACRKRAASELRRLPVPLRALSGTAEYAVEIAPALRALAREVDRRYH